MNIRQPIEHLAMHLDVDNHQYVAVALGGMADMLVIFIMTLVMVVQNILMTLVMESGMMME